MTDALINDSITVVADRHGGLLGDWWLSNRWCSSERAFKMAGLSQSFTQTKLDAQTARCCEVLVCHELEGEVLV